MNKRITGIVMTKSNIAKKRHIFLFLKSGGIIVIVVKYIKFDGKNQTKTLSENRRSKAVFCNMSLLGGDGATHLRFGWVRYSKYRLNIM
ncbi:hypothetical protein JW935_14700, partial [candidate division KSB1 bacterium]|nr:hypothetical protein [candidate division KSB1 bacterium]